MFNVMDGVRANCWNNGLSLSSYNKMCFSNHAMWSTQSQVFWD